MGVSFCGCGMGLQNGWLGYRSLVCGEQGFSLVAVD